MTRTKVSTVILSDVHIGSEHSKVKELTSFLKNIDCDKLILNGDILDGWKLQRNPFGRWKRSYTELIKVIMKMMEKHGTKVIYVRGNHDDFLDKILPETGKTLLLFFTVCQTQGKICRILYFRFREGTDSTCSSPSFRRNYLRTYSSAGKYMVWKYSLSQFW